MNNDAIDISSKEMWERAKTIFFSTLQNDEERQQVDRYFSMINSVTISDNVLHVLTSNAFAADLLKSQYGDKIKSCLILACSDSSIQVCFSFDATAKPAIIVPVESFQSLNKSPTPESSPAEKPEQQAAVQYPCAPHCRSAAAWPRAYR